MDKVYINIASQSHRSHTLNKTIESLYDQADIINVALNGFDKIPKFLNKKKIKVVSDGNDYGAAGKFLNAGKVKGYYLTADDDLLYPKDYVSYITHLIDLYKRQAVIGVHGTIYTKFPIRSYYHYDRQILYAVNGNATDKFVHMLGTGTLGFHTDTLPGLSIKNFPEKRMCDPYFAKYCIEHNVAQISLTRAANWIKLQSTDSDSGSIWREVSKNDTKQTAIINSIKNFRIVKKDIVERALFTDANLDEKAVIEIFKIIKDGDHILELGSGVTTGQLAKYYKMNSVEHDSRYLHKQNSNYIHAPLKDGYYYFNGTKLPYYDMLIIDGPPASVADRRKVLEHKDKFDWGKPIIIDDVHRDNEMELTKEIEKLTNRKAKIFNGKRKKFAVI